MKTANMLLPQSHGSHSYVLQHQDTTISTEQNVCGKITSLREIYIFIYMNIDNNKNGISKSGYGYLNAVAAMTNKINCE